MATPIEISNIIEAALASPKRQVRITFKQEAPHAAGMMLWLIGEKKISVNFLTWGAFATACQYSHWRGTKKEDRQFLLLLIPPLSTGYFTFIADAIEAIEVVE
jgi:hypothetical protein